MNDATLITDGIGTRPAVRLERRLPDPPTVVWRAITEREHRAWFPSDVVLAGGRWRGASITFPFPPEVIDMTIEGQVLDVDEPNLLVFSWGDEILRFELSPDHGGTLLVLTDELPQPRRPGTRRAGKCASTAWPGSSQELKRGNHTSWPMPPLSSPYLAPRKARLSATKPTYEEQHVKGAGI